MKRDIGALTAERFDILVIGGGVHGAFAAWDAALRGLRVALIERCDFGSGASSNSLKIAHGGFRHLRHGDLRALRGSLDEQIALQRIAPHLVRPLPCVMEVGQRVSRNGTLVGAALGFYREVARRRALRAGTERVLEMNAGGIVEGDALARLLAPLDLGWRAGALWTDALIRSPERLMIGVLRSAVAAGAVVASYVEARAIVPRDGDVTVEVVGEDEGRFAIHTRLVLDSRGAWSSQAIVHSGSDTRPASPPGRRGRSASSAPLASPLGRASRSAPSASLANAEFSPRCPHAAGGGDCCHESRAPLARAGNIVVRAPVPRAAIALPHPSEPRMLFAVPWCGRLMLGTAYEHARPASDPREGIDVERLVRLFGDALPGISLARGDLEYVHSGLLPAANSGDGAVKLRNRPRIVDFREVDGVEGVVSMEGVKWTTARAVAECAVDVCQAKLGSPVRRGGTDRRPIAGGEAVSGAAARKEAEKAARACAEGKPLAGDFERELYGSLAIEVDAIARENPALALPLAPGSRVIGAQIAHAIRHEMAVHLDDVVLRRSELGTAGMPSEAELGASAAIAAGELGWPRARVAAELARVRGAYWWKCV